MLDGLDAEIQDAVKWYWATRSNQGDAQQNSENTARKQRAEVLGGKQMDGFAGLIEDLLVDAGIPRSCVKHDYHATLPGFFRPEKEWDTAVVVENELLAVIEYKSQASSFGNNLNNRAEEAVGSFSDLMEAYEEGLFEPSPAPWVGYLYLMADNSESRAEPRLREPTFEADDEFRDATYIERMELLCLRMVRKRLVDSASFLLSEQERGHNGGYWEPNQELTFERFSRALVGHVKGHTDA